MKYLLKLEQNFGVSFRNLTIVSSGLLSFCSFVPLSNPSKQSQAKSRELQFPTTSSTSLTLIDPPEFVNLRTICCLTSSV